ncbi:MAG TPA: class I SAM-dependent methyltransferase [Candidatus Polarisedimenticolaceae bacterium]|nr:class I SAM-dependent methyltransferase [Candidatus Polarisedimenticolaceae bacterium]
MEVLSLLKQFPVDLGQGTQRAVTRGKSLAKAHVPPAPRRGATLLDVGCREGTQSRIFRELGYQVTSIDVDKVWEDCQVVDCNGPLPFGDDSFDIVWSSEVIEHLIDPVAAANEMRRVLRPGGTLVLTTPNSFPVYFCGLAMVGLTPQRLQRADHLHFFDERQIRRVFPDAQLEGFLPFTGFRPRLRRGVGAWSPTFVVVERKQWPSAGRSAVPRMAVSRARVARSQG